MALDGPLLVRHIHMTRPTSGSWSHVILPHSWFSDSHVSHPPLPVWRQSRDPSPSSGMAGVT